MAEFSEVMRQARRMCASFGVTECNGCPMHKEDCSCMLSFDIDDRLPMEWKLENVDEIDALIMRWAAEHPEPKYPTWREWLQLEMDKSIPADVAEKLGIRPIGGKVE